MQQTEAGQYNGRATDAAAAKYTGTIQMFCLEDNRARQKINRNDKGLILFIKDDDKYKKQGFFFCDKCWSLPLGIFRRVCMSYRI